MMSYPLNPSGAKFPQIQNLIQFSIEVTTNWHLMEHMFTVLPEKYILNRTRFISLSDDFAPDAHVKL